MKLLSHNYLTDIEITHKIKWHNDEENMKEIQFKIGYDDINIIEFRI